MDHLVDELLPSMRRVVAADRDLRDLGLVWTMIEASSAIGCADEADVILPTLSQTRERFGELQARLVRRLGLETLAEVRDELVSTAQCCIDILVRNLFERTADVGFLATDDALCEFVALDADARARARPAMVGRLTAYRSKYTVYDDIVVLDAQGRVLARLDEDAPLERSADPVVAAAVAKHGYVEQYATSDLAAGERAALLYAHRIEDPQGRVIGVLVLRFRLADELDRVFHDLARSQRPAALALVDDSGIVQRSSDEGHLPVHARLFTGQPGRLELTTFAGREYLAVTCPTKGYQGYGGPGWRAVAMVSLNLAFRSQHHETSMQDGVALDNEELRRIQSDMDAINRNLRRVVWNGRLMAGSGSSSRRSQLKAVLQQVNDAGSRMRERAGRAIRDLYRASLGRAQQQAAELARLAADIMDRNLYERANDCRWWALSPVLQTVLAQPSDAQGSERLNEVLGTINGLYTVYTRLVVFDASGLIRGATHDDMPHPLLGASMPQDLLEATLALSDTQSYAVSPFGGSPLSGGVPTYIYLAAVRTPGGGSPIGGIAIVFNAQREFKAMLDDVLDGRTGMAAFIDAEGKVLASTDDGQAIGSTLRLPREGGVMERDGANFAVASVSAGGYREFKVSDGYANGVRAVVALRLGALERRRMSLFDCPLRALPSASPRTMRELALFQVGSSRYALPTDAVLEARPPQGLVRVAQGGNLLAGLLEVPTADGSAMVPVICARGLLGLTDPPRSTDGIVLVMADLEHAGRPLYGLRVDDVISVIDVDHRHIQPAPAGLRSHAPWLQAMVRMNAGGVDGQQVLAQVLNPQGLQALVRLPVQHQAAEDLAWGAAGGEAATPAGATLSTA